MLLLLNILEMEENDLIDTANNITDSYSNNKFENYEKFLINLFQKKLDEFNIIIENLAKTFFKYMNYLKENSGKIKFSWNKRFLLFN